MSLFPLKPTHAPVRNYFAALAQFEQHGHTTEGNTRSAFADLLKKCCSPYKWHLVEEYAFKGTSKQPLRADGALIDELTLQYGIWEAKDTADDLDTEIQKKRAADPMRDDRRGVLASEILKAVSRQQRSFPQLPEMGSYKGTYSD